MKKTKQPSPNVGDFFPFDDLPEGWECKKLGEIISPSKEKIEPTANSTLPYIGLEHIESNKSKIIGQAIASEAKSTKTVFRSGDVLYGKLRPYLNKVAIPDFDGVCSTDILVFNQNQIIDSRYLMRYLTTGDVVEYANLKSKGLSLPRVSFESLSEILIPLPPLAEQQRIVARVEALLTSVNAARDRISRVPLIMKKFRQTVLAAACEGRLTEEWREENPDLDSVQNLINDIRRKKTVKKSKTSINIEELVSNLPILPEKWVYAFLNEIAVDAKNAIKRGPFGSSIKKEFFVPNGFKIYEQRNVIYNDFKLGRYYINNEKFQEMIDFQLKSGDIAISCSGTIGKIAIVPQNIDPGIINQALLKITFNNNLINSQYYVDLFHTDYFQKTILASARGSAMQNISSVSEIKQIPIPLPPLAEQHEIVRRVGMLFERADAIDREVAAAGQRCERLTQAVLARAFAGKL